MKYIVIMKLRCPGLSNRKEAHMYEVEDERTNAWLAETQRVGRLIDDRVLSYAVFDDTMKDHAIRLTKQINAEAEQELAKWRHEVYDEPYMAHI